MQATQTFNEPRIGRRAPAMVAAILTALVLGGAGGYVAKSVTTVGQTANHAAAAPVMLSAGGSDSQRSLRADNDFTPGYQSSSAPATGDDCIRVKRAKVC